jgi:hypothetical protein
MFCLMVVFGQASIVTNTLGTTLGTIRVTMRAELTSKVVGCLTIKKDWATLDDLSLFLQRQGAEMLGSTKSIPFTFLRVKLSGMVVSRLHVKQQKRFVLHGDQMDQLIELTESRDAVVDLLWEDDKYEILCRNMHKTFDKFDYKVVGKEGVLDCTVERNKYLYESFFMPHAAYKFHAQQLVVRVTNMRVDSRAFLEFARSDASIKVLTLCGGKLKLPIYTPLHLPLNHLEELRVLDPSYDFSFLCPKLKRLKVCNFGASEFGISDSPSQLTILSRLVELDLSDNDSVEIPSWVERLTTLESLILHNNPRLKGNLNLQSLNKLTKLDVRSCGFTQADLDSIAELSNKSSTKSSTKSSNKFSDKLVILS